MDGGGVGALIIVGSAKDLGAVLGGSPSAAALDALDRGAAVSLYPGFVARGEVTFDWLSDKTGNRTGPPASVPAIVDQPRHEGYFGLVISPATARRLGIFATPATVIADLPSAPTGAQLHTLTVALGGIGDGELSPLVETGPDASNTQLGWGMVILAIAVCLAAAALTTALSRATNPIEDDALIALGSTPGFRRRYAFWQAVVPVATGSILGTALGILPSLAVSVPVPGGTAQAMAYAPLWGELAVLALATPALIGAVAWLTAGRRGWTRRVAPIG